MVRALFVHFDVLYRIVLRYGIPKEEKRIGEQAESEANTCVFNHARGRDPAAAYTADLPNSLN